MSRNPQRFVQTGMLHRLEDAIGKELTRDIRAGEPIHDKAIRPPVVVRRQQIVPVRAYAGGLVVTTQARALEDGSVGDVVLMESLETREKYTARVADGHVEVFVTGISVRSRRDSSQPAVSAALRPGRRSSRSAAVSSRPVDASQRNRESGGKPQ